MAIDACHVIYEIRITRQDFKSNPEPGQTKSWRNILYYHCMLPVVSLHAHAVVSS